MIKADALGVVVAKPAECRPARPAAIDRKLARLLGRFGRLRSPSRWLVVCGGDGLSTNCSRLTAGQPLSTVSHVTSKIGPGMDRTPLSVTKSNLPFLLKPQHILVNITRPRLQEPSQLASGHPHAATAQSLQDLLFAIRQADSSHNSPDRFALRNVIEPPSLPRTQRRCQPLTTFDAVKHKAIRKQGCGSLLKHRSHGVSHCSSGKPGLTLERHTVFYFNVPVCPLKALSFQGCIDH